MIEHLKKLNKIDGVIQVGANYGQEVNELKKFTKNIILIEPVPEIAKFLSEKFPDCKIFEYGIGSDDFKTTLYKSSNQGASSSILKPENVLNMYPWISFNESIEIEVKKIETLILNDQIDINNYNVLISDTQGYELHVLKGCGKYINKFDIIIVEFIDCNLYQNDASLENIKNYLSEFGFELLDLYDGENGRKIGHGDAIFKNLASLNFK